MFAGYNGAEYHFEMLCSAFANFNILGYATVLACE